MTTKTVTPAAAHFDTYLAPRLTEWEDARDHGSQEDMDMASGRVMDELLALGPVYWQELCKRLVRVKGT